MKNELILGNIKNGLIVSCQALKDEPLHSPLIMSKMALAAYKGGAVGIRANTVADILKIREQVDLPIIGIIKNEYKNSKIYIAPTLKEVEELIRADVDIIAFDATLRERPDNTTIREIIMHIHKAGKLAMADISDYREGKNAFELGADLVSTTLSGYTDYSPKCDCPDFGLISRLSKTIRIPVIAEGRIVSPQDAVKCFKNGAYSVIVGSAITRPQEITKRFTNAIQDFDEIILKKTAR